jgi:hypothetical protein
MHLDEERIERAAHGELLPSELVTVRVHLEHCTACQELVRQAEREQAEVNALLGQLDHPLPVVDAETLAAGSAWRGGWGRWAAGILLVAGAASAVYALPDSPLRQWVQSRVNAAVEQPGATSQTAPAEAPDEAGIAIVPSASYRILFSVPQDHGTATVVLTDSAEVMVRTRDGAVTFTSNEHELVISNRGSVANYQIQLPRAALRIELWVGARRVLLKQGVEINVGGMRAASGPYVIPLRPPQ